MNNFEEKRTELILKADRLAKRVNDNLDYLYKTSPERARIAEKAIMSYNRGIGDIKISKKTGKIQVSRSYEGLTLSQIERRIARVERIVESNRTSAKGFQRTADLHRNYWEQEIGKITGVETHLTKKQSKMISEAWASISPGKFDSDTVREFIHTYKNFSDSTSFIKALEDFAGIEGKEMKQKIEENPNQIFRAEIHTIGDKEWVEWFQKTDKGWEKWTKK